MERRSPTRQRNDRIYNFHFSEWPIASTGGGGRRRPLCQLPLSRAVGLLLSYIPFARRHLFFLAGRIYLLRRHIVYLWPPDNESDSAEFPSRRACFAGTFLWGCVCLLMIECRVVSSLLLRRLCGLDFARIHGILLD